MPDRRDEGVDLVVLLLFHEVLEPDRRDEGVDLAVLLLFHEVLAPERVTEKHEGRQELAQSAPDVLEKVYSAEEAPLAPGCSPAVIAISGMALLSQAASEEGRLHHLPPRPSNSHTCRRLAADAMKDVDDQDRPTKDPPSWFLETARKTNCSTGRPKTLVVVRLAIVES